MIKLIITSLTYIIILFNCNSLVAEEPGLKVGLLAPFSGEHKDLGQSLLLSTQLALNDSGNQCLARIRTVHNRHFNKEIDNTAPYWYYRDSEGYSYGYQCKKPRMSGKPCCSMHQPKYDISSISLITEKPVELIQYEKEQAEVKSESDTDIEGQIENYNSDHDSDENSKHELTLERVEIKNRGTFLICKETQEIFTLEERKLVGEIIAGTYIFN